MLSNSAAFLAISVGLLVSLLRYRLYDAEAVISRSAAYTVLILLLGVVFTASEKIIELLGEEYFGQSSRALAGGLAAGVAAMLIAPLHERMHRWAEHRFQRDLVHLRKGLPLLIGDMRETATFQHLAEAVLERVTRGVRAVRAALIMDGKRLEANHVAPDAVDTWLAEWRPPPEESQVHCDRADKLFPVQVPLAADGVGIMGWLVLGPRPDGSLYGRDERRALHDIADPIARALAIVRRREVHEVELVNEVRNLRTLMNEIGGRLAGLEGAAPIERNAT